MQSSLEHISPMGLHVAVIMDGNGRWATARRLPRTTGHRAGIEAARHLVEAAPEHGIRHLTLYAFSSDNWRRPAAEVRALMHLLRRHLPAEATRCAEHGVRLSVIGRRDQLPEGVHRVIENAEALTADGHALHLRLAIDYSGRDALARAASQVEGPASRADFARALAHAYHADEPVPDVDLLIRTGGEQRLSDFLLWECAYAELYFTDVLWPDFDAEALRRAIDAFHGRERRFGGLPEPSVPAFTVPDSPRVANGEIGSSL